MAAQWPLIVARLLVLLPTLPGWSDVAVIDGLPLTADIPTDAVTVGYVTDDNAGAYTTIQDDSGFQWQEMGTVRGELSCVTGDTDLASMRTRMFGLIGAFQDSIRADRTLGGVLSPTGTVDLQVDVRSVQDVSGTEQSAVFTLTYFTIT